MELIALNERFGIGGKLWFAAGPGGMAHAFLRVGQATAEVAIQGGQVLRYGEDGAPPLLWVSREALYAPGKPVRGGIPVCWPWFGPHPDDPAKPAHGFARNQMWAVAGTDATDDQVALHLVLEADEASRRLWPYPFVLQLSVTLGAALDVALTMSNPGPESFSCGGALHSYLAVADVTRVHIIGLEGTPFFDQLTSQEQIQDGPVTISAEVDRVYRDSGEQCMVEDELLARRILVRKSGSGTTVVWNPWIEKARRLADFADDEYPTMLCVETALALDDRVTLAPNASHTLRATISAAPL